MLNKLRRNSNIVALDFTWFVKTMHTVPLFKMAQPSQDKLLCFLKGNERKCLNVRNFV